MVAVLARVYFDFVEICSFSLLADAFEHLLRVFVRYKEILDTMDK